MEGEIDEHRTKSCARSWVNTPNSNPSPSVLDPSIGMSRPERAERRVLLPNRKDGECEG